MGLGRDDIARLGPSAQRQIDAAKFAFAEQQRQMDLLPKARGKYGNERTLVEGRWFDSKAEARRYAVLRLLLEAGEIRGLVRQPELLIVVNGCKICSYFADFSYHTKEGVEIYEDVKSPVTKRCATFRLKKKLVCAVHGIEVQEVEA